MDLVVAPGHYILDALSILKRGYGESDMVNKTYTPEDIESIGTAIYIEKIRSLMEPGDKGKFVVIDVYSGDYEMDERSGAAIGSLLKRRPGAHIYTVRVGYPIPYSVRWPRLQYPKP